MPTISRPVIAAFFDVYLAAFDDPSGASMSRFYALPSVMTRADGSIFGFSDPEQMRTVLAQVAGGYQAQGARAWRYEQLDVQPLGRDAALASLDWLMLDRAGTILRRWRHSYVLNRAGEDLRIIAAVFNVSGTEDSVASA